MKITHAALSLITLAGLGVISTTAQADEPARDFAPAKIDTYLYINAATGERTWTSAPASRSGDLIWQNDDITGGCGFFFGMDRPTRDTSAGKVKFGATIANWGDIPAQSMVGGFEFAFAYQSLTEFCQIADGFTVRLGFIERYDSAVAPGGPITEPGGPGAAFEVAAFEITGFDGPGEPPICEQPFTRGLMVIVDLERSGLEFTLGDVASGLGADVDADGLPDFGYSYRFFQPDTAPKVIAGPMLVRPASLGGGGTAAGVPDSYSWFNNLAGPTVQYADYVGDFLFGTLGGDCSIPVPYAVTYMNLYGVFPFEICRRIDFNGDEIIDFIDYLEFLNRFEAADPAADLSDDGVIDFGDWLVFYNWYYECTPG